jgi:hypothetical protein
MNRARGILGVLQGLDLLTPERLERIKRSAEKTGAARVLRALKAYDDAVRAYKAGQAKPLALARAHAELVSALEQNANEVRGVASHLVALFRSARAPKR